MSTILHGEIHRWPSKSRMASILAEAGLRIEVGHYSIRVLDCSHFVFRDYGADSCVPTIDADADTVEELLREAHLVSETLGRSGIRHRFEIYQDAQGQLIGYLHHDWPK